MFNNLVVKSSSHIAATSPALIETTTKADPTDHTDDIYQIYTYKEKERGERKTYYSCSYEYEHRDDFTTKTRIQHIMYE